MIAISLLRYCRERKILKNWRMQVLQIYEERRESSSIVASLEIRQCAQEEFNGPVFLSSSFFSTSLLCFHAQVALTPPTPLYILYIYVAYRVIAASCVYSLLRASSTRCIYITRAFFVYYSLLVCTWTRCTILRILLCTSRVSGRDFPRAWIMLRRGGINHLCRVLANKLASCIEHLCMVYYIANDCCRTFFVDVFFFLFLFLREASGKLWVFCDLLYIIYYRCFVTRREGEKLEEHLQYIGRKATTQQQRDRSPLYVQSI